MSYICDFCCLRPDNCGCSVDLTEPRLESELVVADNIMAVENPVIQKSYGLLDAPSPADFFSLLVELEEQEKEDFELGPLPKFMRQPNNQEQDEPLICDGPMPSTPPKLKLEIPSIPKLERQTNMPPGIQIEDLKDLNVELFPEEDDELPNIEYCENCSDFSCECDKMVPCDCGKMYHIDEPYGMCFDCEMDYRRQDSIDQANYPDDIRERYDSH